MTSKSKEIYHGTALIAESSDSDEDVFVTGSHTSESILTRNNRKPSSPKRKKRLKHVYILSEDDEDSEPENHVDCHIQTEIVTGTSDIIGIDSSKRLRKRRSTTSITISSDDDEETLDKYTPGTLRNRNRTSTTKVQRALHLEKKSTTSLDRKSSRSLSFNERPSQLVDQEGPSSPEKLGYDVPDYSSVDFENIHELHQLVNAGTQLNWYMRLSNRKSFIATAQFVPVTDVNLNDYIGPIPVQKCPNVKEHSVVEVKKELADVCKALITKSCGKALKFESAKKPKLAVTAGIIHKKPCRKDAHATYVQMILSSVLDSDFLDSLEEKPDPFFDEAKKVIHEALDIRIVNLVESSVWDARFKEMLIHCRFLKDKPLRKARKAKCEACGRQRHITRSFVFYEAGSDGKKITPMKKFAIGCDCAKRGIMYRKLVRYDSRLRQSCIKKVNRVKAKGILSDKDVVNDCIYNDKWLKMRFDAFEALLDDADGYATEGKEHKRLRAKYNKEVEWL